MSIGLRTQPQRSNLELFHAVYLTFLMLVGIVSVCTYLAHQPTLMLQ